MNFRDTQDKLFKKGWPTPLGWGVLILCTVFYVILKHHAQEHRASLAALQEHRLDVPHSELLAKKNKSEVVGFPEPPLPASPPPLSIPSKEAVQSLRQFNQPSFGNLNPANHILSDDFLPKGTILYATLTSDIVSNNQVSPAIATIIYPAIFAHKVRIPVGTQITGKISPGNLRGRVFVNWDTLVFCEEGRQGWELPIKGIGMTYEENTDSGRWIINGAGLKGYIFDDSSAQAFKLAALRSFQDFTKTLQTYVTTQNSAVTAGSVVTTTTTTPQATLQNSGLAAAEGFIDVIASRYAANLQQQNSYVLVPTAKLCAIFLEEPIDISTAAPGRSIQQVQR